MIEMAWWQGSGMVATVAVGVLLLGCTGGGEGAESPQRPAPTPAATVTARPSSGVSPSPERAGGGSATCSAEDRRATAVPDERLPARVRATRNRIVRLAVACDYDGLAALAAKRFVYSFAGGDKPASFWRSGERRGDAPLGTLVDLLRHPAALDHGTWVWPRRVADHDQTYLGPRVGIEPDGSWVWYVSGD
jgi:hypothetical protein